MMLAESNTRLSHILIIATWITAILSWLYGKVGLIISFIIAIILGYVYISIKAAT